MSYESANKGAWPGALMRWVMCLLAATTPAWPDPAMADVAPAPAIAQARIVAVGLPGAAAIAPVGYFHPGGPIRDKPAFAAFTERGRILDPDRIVVTSSSNFGAPKAVMAEPEGAVLSLDPGSEGVIVIPPAFAASGTQASVLDGRVQLFTAQSPAFLNGVNTPGAVTADRPPVSNPLGISINNGFGRLWFANAPGGATGTDSIEDPNGVPLAGAPSKVVGGVFSGDKTGRAPQLIDGGLRAGAMGNTLLGMSSDGSKRAVFALLTADGAISQAHTEQGLDGLAPPGTVTPITLPAPDAAAAALVTRAGIIFNWVPDRIIYASDPIANAIVAVKLSDDGKVFRVDGIRRFTDPALSTPVDLAPAVPEVGSPGFSSNTVMAGASDLYIVNRGNGTVVRMTQTGRVVAIRQIAVGGQPVGPRRLNGIGVSRDAKRIWLTVSGGLAGYEAAPGGVIEIAAFGAGGSAALVPPAPRPALVEQGATLFAATFTPDTGLGPLFDKQSCIECHSFPIMGGMGPEGIGLVLRVGRFEAGHFDPLLGRGGPVARRRTVAELGVACAIPAGMPPDANLVSVRNAPPLFGEAALEAVADNDIRALATAQAGAADGVAGRVNVVRDAAGQERVGRLGWKAQSASLTQFVADAMRNELGITNPLAPADAVPVPAGCAVKPSPRDDGSVLLALTAYVASLPPPDGAVAVDAPGMALFASAGCATCHTPQLRAGQTSIRPFSDLLLHDMGPALDDGMVQAAARGRDWRTTPLWGLKDRIRYLHDGRATTLQAAINAHGGEADRSAASFRRLPAEEQTRLLTYLSGL